MTEESTNDCYFESHNCYLKGHECKYCIIYKDIIENKAGIGFWPSVIITALLFSIFIIGIWVFK
jgi:hypothetical protein